MTDLNRQPLVLETNALPIELMSHVMSAALPCANALLLAEEEGIEPSQWRDQNPLPYHLATPLQSKCTKLMRFD